MIFGQPTTQMLSIMIASFIIILFGIVDDINPLKARYKLIGQLIASIIIVFYGGIVLKDAYIFSYYLDFGGLAPYVTITFSNAPFVAGPKIPSSTRPAPYCTFNSCCLLLFLN